MHKAAAHNFSNSKYKALRRMGLCSGSASSNSNRAALSVCACVVHAWATLLDRAGCRKPDGVGYTCVSRTRVGCEWGSTAMVSGREIQRFFSPHGVRHRFVFYAADRELSEELPRELPKELPEMRQVGLKLTKLAANVAKITILAASLVNIAILAASLANASMANARMTNASLANEENPSNFRVSTRTLGEELWEDSSTVYHSQIKARAS